MMEVIDINNVSERFEGTKIDYFITCASFEHRSYFLLNSLVNSNIGCYCVFATTDFDDTIEQCRSSILALLASKRYRSVDLKLSDPVFSYSNITTECLSIFKKEKITAIVDVSTFTHEHLLILFRVLYDHKRSDDTIFLSYTPVKSYSFNDKKTSDKWLTKGVKGLRSVIGFPGYSDPTKKNHLIILVGFEVERVLKIIECFDFEMVTLVVGAKDNSISSVNQEINEDRYDQILKLHANAQKLEVSLTDPVQVKNTILNYVRQSGDYNTVVAPMNNKISTLGVGYAAIENSDIQLFYMQANTYNIAGYSEPRDEFYIYELWNEYSA